MPNNTIILPENQIIEATPDWLEQVWHDCMEPRTAEVLWKPDVCQWVLEHRNTGNRPFAKGFARRYALTMTDGRWRNTTDAYGFYRETGDIQNGQKRIWAQADSGTTLVVTTKFGLPPESREGQDMGQRRVVTDLLAMDGLPKDRSYGAALRYILIMRWVWKGKMASFNDSANQPLMSDMLALAKDEELRDSFAVGVLMQKSEARMPCSVGTALHYLASMATDYETATRFFETVQEGDMLDPRSPVKRLRKALINNALDRRKMSAEVMCAMVIKAFNWTLHKVPMDQLSWRNDEKFPIFGGKPSETVIRRRGLAEVPDGVEK